MSLVLYGCGASSPTVRTQRMGRVFENRVLRLIMDPKRTEMYGGWRIIRYAEVHRS